MSASSSSAASHARRRWVSAGGLAAAAVLFVAVNVAVNGGLKGARLDLTADRLYSLTDGTRQVLQKIDEPVTLRFYYSDRLGREVPSYATFAARVRSLLEEYRAIARGKLKLEILNPEPFSDEEDRAVAAGLQGVPVDQSGETVYFGLVGTNSVDGREVIPFFQPEREAFLEYDLTKLVNALANPQKPVVGILSTLPVQGGPMGMGMPFGRPQMSEPWFAFSQLEQFFETRTIAPSAAEVPAEVKVLVVVHPKGLSDQALYAIDQFVMRGGRLIVLVDPNSEAEQFAGAGPMGAPPGAETASTLDKLFDAWGVAFDKTKVVVDRNMARRVSTGQAAGSGPQAVDYVAWIEARAPNLDRGDVLTSELSRLNFATAGALGVSDKGKAAGLAMAPLVVTTPTASTMPSDKFGASVDPLKILNEYKAGLSAQVLAARYSGPLASAFPDGAPKAPEKEKKDDAAAPKEEPKAAPQPHKAKSDGPANLIVFADVDWLQDRFWVRLQSFFGQNVAVPTAQNGDLLINAVDNMAGSSALIGLRSRGVSSRPFLVIESLQREAESQFRATEQSLKEKLKDAEKKLADLRKGDEGKSVIVTPEQQKAIEGFRGEMVGIRQQLRDVQRALRTDIERLQAGVRWLNIALVPALVAAAAVLVFMMRTRRRRRAAAA
ncbi:MAG: GldG family protein [Alphaproteobacteria bacterium]|nr:GldG family protein [Alphaproteobacteria bacterium]